MNELERNGLETLQKMDFKCFGDLGHIQVKSVFPDATISHGEHFEFDYFALVGNKCLVGEMSGLGNERDIERKYKRFCHNFEFLRGARDANFFGHFNIPSGDRHLFDEVRSIQGFFIAHEHERFDLDLAEVENVRVICREDWDTIEQYAEYMGRYAQYPFLKLLGITDARDVGEDLRFEVNKSKLSRMPNKMIATGIGVRSDVFVFETHPAKLLNIVEVYRRELIPVVAFTEDSHYQRRLDIKKLKLMGQLVKDPDFMFPNSILVTLSEKCMYDRSRGKLIIPEIYGSISVIDGQHRLFSYANCKIPDEVREEANILVTALYFKTEDPGTVLRCSAKTFIEINTEQKKVSSDHISEIAYSVLGEEYPKALAAQVILRCNQKSGKPLYGMFNSSQTTKGVYKATTVITYLAGITNVQKVRELKNANTSRKSQMKLGYVTLLDKDIEELSDASVLIEQSSICLERFFACVKRVFKYDWPDRENLTNTISSLVYAKVFSAFINLLRKFIQEGLNWNQIQQEIQNIHDNILRKRGLALDSAEVVLPIGNKLIPDDQPPVNKTFKFLDRNRRAPTSIDEI